MHAPPPFQITLRRFRAWRVACGLLVLLSLSALAAWAPKAVAAHAGWLAVAVVMWCVASASLAAHAWCLNETRLRWDGQLWHLARGSESQAEPLAGWLSVTADLGSWMLLRFTPQGSGRGVWLPAQHQGHAHEWHGLRATVYCARPVSPPTATPF